MTVDADQHAEARVIYGIETYPTIRFFVNARMADQYEGKRLAADIVAAADAQAPVHASVEVASAGGAASEPAATGCGPSAGTERPHLHQTASSTLHPVPRARPPRPTPAA